MSWARSFLAITAQAHGSAPTTHAPAEILLSGVGTRTLQKFRPSGSAGKPRPPFKAFLSRSPYWARKQQRKPRSPLKKDFTLHFFQSFVTVLIFFYTNYLKLHIYCCCNWGCPCNNPIQSHLGHIEENLCSLLMPLRMPLLIDKLIEPKQNWAFEVNQNLICHS